MVISSLLMYRVRLLTTVEKTLDAPTRSKRRGHGHGHEAAGHQDNKTPSQTMTWEIRYRYVLCNYLTGWFLIDVLSVAPSAFDIYELASPKASPLELSSKDLVDSSNGTSLLDEGDGGGNLKVVKVLRVVRTLRLFKLLRLMRGSRMMKRWATR